MHYPLPLQFEEKPDVATLQRTIQRLRAELERASTSGDGIAGGAGAKNEDTEMGKMRHEIGRLRREKEDLAEACESRARAVRSACARRAA